MKFEIRNYHITDLSSLYKICLLTANNGGDSTSFLEDPDLVGHLFAAPYAIFEPNLCFILSKDSIPSGYILGTRDSMQFYEKCEKNGFLNYENDIRFQMTRMSLYRLISLGIFIKSKKW